MHHRMTFMQRGAQDPGSCAPVPQGAQGVASLLKTGDSPEFRGFDVSPPNFGCIDAPFFTAVEGFIRNSSHLTNHQPLNIGGTNYTPQCTGMAGGLCGGTGPGARTENYSGALGPGGVY